MSDNKKQALPQRSEQCSTIDRGRTYNRKKIKHEIINRHSHFYRTF